MRTREPMQRRKKKKRHEKCLAFVDVCEWTERFRRRSKWIFFGIFTRSELEFSLSLPAQPPQHTPKVQIFGIIFKRCKEKRTEIQQVYLALVCLLWANRSHVYVHVWARVWVGSHVCLFVCFWPMPVTHFTHTKLHKFLFGKLSEEKTSPSNVDKFIMHFPLFPLQNCFLYLFFFRRSLRALISEF